VKTWLNIVEEIVVIRGIGVQTAPSIQKVVISRKVRQNQLLENWTTNAKRNKKIIIASNFKSFLFLYDQKFCN
jgi:hypothetical protein